MAIWIKKNKKKQVFFIDCRHLTHVTLKQHAGTHTEIIGKVWKENRDAVATLFRIFLRELRATAPRLYENKFPFALAAFCDGGRHRSLAVLCMLQYCLWSDGFNIDPRLWCLNEPQWGPDQCLCERASASCKHCDFKVSERNDNYWADILSVYRENRAFVMY